MRERGVSPAVVSLLVGLLLGFWSSARPVTAAAAPGDQDGDGDEPKAKVTTQRCQLARGHAGTVRVARQPESCGSGGCSKRTTITVHNADGGRLMTLTNDEGDFTGDEIDVAIRCRAGLVEVVSGDPPSELVLPLRFDPGTGRLRLGGPAPEADGWKRPPLAGDAAKQRRDTARQLDAVLNGGEADDPNTHRRGGGWAYNHVDGIDRALTDGIWALVARDEVEAGDWVSAETILDRISEARGTEGEPEPPPPVVKRRVAEVRALLAETRRRSAPLKVAERRRLGRTMQAQRLPIDPGEPATTFWRKDELCVIQEETPPRHMRCYAPAAKRWGPSVPIERPANDGHGLKQVTASGHHVEYCSGTRDVVMVLPRDVPDAKANPCQEDGGVELDAVLAIVDGGKLLTFGAKLGFTITQGRAAEATDVDARDASALLRQSAGSLLVGDGCCVLGRNARLTRLRGDGPEKSWDLRGPPPRDEKWTGPPLASPDQRWVLAQSAKPGQVTLWLYRVEPVAKP